MLSFCYLLLDPHKTDTMGDLPPIKQPIWFLAEPKVSPERTIASTEVSADGTPLPPTDLTNDPDDDEAHNPPPASQQGGCDEGEYIEFGGSGLFNEKIKLGKEFSEDDLEGHVPNPDWQKICARNLWVTLNRSARKPMNEERDKEFGRIEGFLRKVCAALNPYKDERFAFIWGKYPFLLRPDTHEEKQKSHMYRNLMAAVRRHCPRE